MSFPSLRPWPKIRSSLKELAVGFGLLVISILALAVFGAFLYGNGYLIGKHIINPLAGTTTEPHKWALLLLVAVFTIAALAKPVKRLYRMFFE